MDIIPDTTCPVHPLDKGWYHPHVAQMDMLRLDMLHPVVSGNKWYKLKHNLARIRESGHGSVLTFGGAYSNHLIATAAAACLYNIPSIGMVRGIHAQENLTPTLAACLAYGMQLEFLSREEYDKKNDMAWRQQLAYRYDTPYIIPEGGANEWGRAGAAEIARQITPGYTHVCVPVGTGTTLAGIRNALPDEVQVLGYAPMKGGRYLQEEILPYLQPHKAVSYQVFDEWHFGGFGKCKEELVTFMNRFYSQHNIPLDMIYTGKMMYGILQQLHRGSFPADARILCIHTGGLQGNAIFKEKLIY